MRAELSNEGNFLETMRDEYELKVGNVAGQKCYIFAFVQF